MHIKNIFWIHLFSYGFSVWEVVDEIFGKVNCDHNVIFTVTFKEHTQPPLFFEFHSYVISIYELHFDKGLQGWCIVELKCRCYYNKWQFAWKNSRALDCRFCYRQATPPPLIWHVVKLSPGGSKHLAGAFQLSTKSACQGDVSAKH